MRHKTYFTCFDLYKTMTHHDAKNFTTQLQKHVQPETRQIMIKDRNGVEKLQLVMHFDILTAIEYYETKLKNPMRKPRHDKLWLEHIETLEGLIHD